MRYLAISVFMVLFTVLSSLPSQAGPLCFSKNKEGCADFPDPSHAVGSKIKSKECTLELVKTEKLREKRIASFRLSGKNGELISFFEVRDGASLQFTSCGVRIHIEQVLDKPDTVWASVNDL